MLVTATCLGLMTALGACGGGQTPGPTLADESQGNAAAGPRGQRGDLSNPTAELTGPLPHGAATSCVEEYSPDAVANRAFAFDGVVVDMGSPRSNRGDGSDLDLTGVTFEIRHWFSGGDQGAATIDMPAPTEGSPGQYEGGPSYAIGSRLLVSGEPRWGGAALADAVAWGCDFTRYYDAATAKSWAQALP